MLTEALHGQYERTMRLGAKVKVPPTSFGQRLIEAQSASPARLQRARWWIKQPAGADIPVTRLVEHTRDTVVADIKLRKIAAEMLRALWCLQAQPNTTTGLSS